MRILKVAKSMTNLGLRGFTLVFRFLLSFYIAKYLGFEATGIYGLAVGMITFTPALVGWGLNYFTSRDVVGKPPEEAGTLVKSRLLVTTASLALATGLGFIALSATDFHLSTIYALILVLLWLETYALDVHLPLIAQEMPIQANIIIFVRSALWAPFVIAAGILFPAARTIEWVFAGWILSYVPTIIVLLFCLRHWPLRTIARAGIRYDWIRMRLKRSWLIYFSDLCLVGISYADRYIVNFILGLALTGVYTFFWTLANALQTLIATAVVQVALPSLVKAHANGSPVEWQGAMRRHLIRTLAMAVILGVAVYAVCEILIRYMGMEALGEHRLVFVLMLFAAIVRSCSDLFSVGLTSLRKDNHYAGIIMGGVLFSVMLCYTLTSLLGLEGAGLASLVTAIAIATANGSYMVLMAGKIQPENAG